MCGIQLSNSAFHINAARGSIDDVTAWATLHYKFYLPL